MEIKAALAEARKGQETQFARDWQDRLKQLKAEEARTPLHGPPPLSAPASAHAHAHAPAQTRMHMHVHMGDTSLQS